MGKVEEIRKDFPILSETVYGKPLVYLDNAATAQKPRPVAEAMVKMMTEVNGNIHRGIHYMSNESTRLYEEARKTIAGFINASTPSEIVMTSGATAAINLVAYGIGNSTLKKGDNVVISALEHHSNIVPWQIVCDRAGAELRVVPIEHSGELCYGELERLIDGRTRIVAVTHASNVLGTITDPEMISRIAHSRGVPVLIDGSQAVVHNRIDVRKLDCDFYVFSGHKIYGPTGTGVLYGKKESLEQLPVFMGGGEMVDTVAFDKTTFAPVPLRFEAGTPNYAGVVALAEAVKYVDGLDGDWVDGHIASLIDKAVSAISDIPTAVIYGKPSHKCPIICFSVGDVSPFDIASILDKQGVAVRSGTHCAQPLMDYYGVKGMCRASLSFYNTNEEIDIFAQALRRAVSMLT